MLLTTLTTLFAATALAKPIIEARIWTDPESGLHVRNIGDQGDGFYLAVFDANNTATVEFTPWAELNHTAPTEEERLVSRNAFELNKRAGTTCSGAYGTPDVGSLDEANRQLARNADQKTYVMHAWGWVHRGDSTSYFCNYQTNWLTYGLIIDMHTIVSDRCGGSHKYGFDRRTHCCGADDLAVGRWWKGRAFCTDHFYG